MKMKVALFISVISLIPLLSIPVYSQSNSNILFKELDNLSNDRREEVINESIELLLESIEREKNFSEDKNFSEYYFSKFKITFVKDSLISSNLNAYFKYLKKTTIQYSNNSFYSHELDSTNYAIIFSQEKAPLVIYVKSESKINYPQPYLLGLINQLAPQEFHHKTFGKKEKSAPFELKWEGDIERNLMVQPLPDIVTDSEATITIRFEVKPDGSIGRIISLKKMNPELEKEVMGTLRSWRFSRLPSGVPQQSQWGTITFRFVVE